MPAVHSFSLGWLIFYSFFVKVMAVIFAFLQSKRDTHTHPYVHICLIDDKSTLIVKTPPLWIFTPSLLSIFLLLLVNAEWQWVTVDLILVIRKGQAESSHTLLQRHITPWNGPSRSVHTLSVKATATLFATFQFIHAISLPHHLREGGRGFLGTGPGVGRLSAVCLHTKDFNKMDREGL